MEQPQQTKDGRLEKDRKHFICVPSSTNPSEQLRAQRIPSEELCPKGNGKENRTPASLGAVDIR